MRKKSPSPSKMCLYLFDGFSLDECSFLTNLLRWGLTKEEGEPFYKTDKEMMSECFFSEWKLRVSKEKFKDLGFFEIGKRNPTKFSTATPYIINYEKFIELNNESVVKKIKEKRLNPDPRILKSEFEDSSRPDQRKPQVHIIDTVLTTDITTIPPISPTGEGNILPFPNKNEEEEKIKNYNIYYGKKALSSLRSPKKPLKNNKFQEWYAEYPRKDARGSAEKAWNRIKLEEAQEIIEKTKLYAKLVKEKSIERHFIPLPSTWLNAHRWMDEELNDFKELNKPKVTAEEKAEATRLYIEALRLKEGNC